MTNRVYQVLSKFLHKEPVYKDVVYGTIEANADVIQLDNTQYTQVYEVSMVFKTIVSIAPEVKYGDDVINRAKINLVKNVQGEMIRDIQYKIHEALSVLHSPGDNIAYLQKALYEALDLCQIKGD